MLLQERINLMQRTPVVRPGRGEDALRARGVQPWHRCDQAGGDASPWLAIRMSHRHERSGRRIVLRRTGGGTARPAIPLTYWRRALIQMLRYSPGRFQDRSGLCNEPQRDHT